MRFGIMSKKPERPQQHGVPGQHRLQFQCRLSGLLNFQVGEAEAAS